MRQRMFRNAAVAAFVLAALLACGGSSSSPSISGAPATWTPAPQDYQANTNVVGSFVSVSAFAQPSAFPALASSLAATRLLLPRAAAASVAASCPLVTSSVATGMITLDFTGCPTNSGQIVFSLLPSAAGSLSARISFLNFGYTYVSGGSTYSGTVQGLFVLSGTSVTNANGSTTYNATTGTGGLVITGTSPAGAMNFNVSEDLYITVSSTSLTEFGLFTYTQGGVTYAGSIPQTSPLTWNSASGCSYPTSGILQIMMNGNTMSTTFGPGCGSMTMEPGNQVATL